LGEEVGDVAVREDHLAPKLNAELPSPDGVPQARFRRGERVPHAVGAGLK